MNKQEIDELKKAICDAQLENLENTSKLYADEPRALSNISYLKMISLFLKNKNKI
jgi:hypothetical protein